MNETKRLTVSILGKSYSIVTDENEQIVQEAAQILDSLMSRVIQKPLSPVDMAKKTTIVALQVAVNLIKERREYTAVMDKTALLNDLLKESATR